ncbi:hypothetical protein JD844_001208 [Phrynosoma platyrhinos]|uniref:Olfactory receptor family 4 n=1 Tax=Phrynosoma platyrhinos TaxID=52577 RepID=A0ABQ7T9F0_PHRPL|nr:hypothetical protein JD844_001208 [Phrynosoma platyrhinos]
MNASGIKEFIFLGLPHSRLIQLFLFILVSACYASILLGNLLIVMTVCVDSRLLQSPMYFFLANLSIIDTALGSVATPKMAAGLINCGGLVHSTTQLILIVRLPFCGPNELDNFFCDVQQVIKLACADTYVTEILIVANSGLLSLVCFIILLVSYGVILATLKGHFKESGRKALSTCSSHLTVVCFIFVPCLFVYLVPFSSSGVDKMASMFYTVVTPALNPIVYSLRNREMKEAMGRLKNKCIFSHSVVKGEKV